MISFINLNLDKKNGTNLNEEGHHVEQLLNVDAAVPVLVKEVEHLHKQYNNKYDDGRVVDVDDGDDGESMQWTMMMV